MGQYYRIAYDDGNLHINDRKVDGKEFVDGFHEFRHLQESHPCDLGW